ncbi:monooxygenase, FAD-binding protein [Minicystis rosea]|nr:monooxygenase, FAD-binding protein [Minicystis rosea]
MKNGNILISGASIAGPTLAYWLRRYGFNPTVVERAPAPRPGGYKIDIRGVAVDVVERMGLYDEIRRAGTDMQGGSYVDATGRWLATIDGETFGFRSGDDVEIMRGDLGHILHEKTRNDVEYVFNDSITSITQDVHGARVTFERGAPRTFDLVIGADGLHSNVRALAFGDEARFAFDLGTYVSIFSVPNHLGLDRWELVCSKPGRLVGLSSTRGDTQAKAFFTFVAPPLRDGARDPARQKELLNDVYAGMGWEVPRLLEAMADAPDFYFDRMTQIDMDRWSAGRVVLVGDAGYCPSPASGQGTSLALVGAYVLAGELAASGGDHHIAFARYEARMRGYVERNQKLGKSAAKHMTQSHRALIWLQILLMRALPHMPWRDSIIRRALQPIRDAAEAISLPQYAG